MTERAGLTPGARFGGRFVPLDSENPIAMKLTKLVGYSRLNRHRRFVYPRLQTK